MPDYASFKLTVSVVTPLHIGSGRELLKDYDFAVHEKQTWRINDAALLDAQDVDDPDLAGRLAQTPPAQLLAGADYLPGSRFFRYVIGGEPRSAAEGAVVREQIKDINDQPYLPGSSLKGALRTALAWFGWGQKELQPDASDLGERPKWAGQALERQLFVQSDARRGHEPNYDLLKALQVSDSQPVDPACLMLVNASVLNRHGELGADIPIEVEAIRPDTTFEMTLKIDLAMFSAWAKARGMNIPGSDWLISLPAVLQAHTRQRVEQEAAWYQAMPNARRPLTFYQQRLGDAPGPNQFLLQLGWGGGWDSKTFGARLRANRPLFQYILNRREYHMVRGRRMANDPFPRSRRIAVTVAQDAQGKRTSILGTPLGWVLVSLEPLHAPAGWPEMTQQAAAMLKPEPIAPIPAPVEPPPAPPAGRRAVPSTGAQERPAVERREPASVGHREPPAAETGREKPAAPFTPAPHAVPAATPTPQPRQAPKPPAPPPPPSPIIAEFTALPKIGNRFRGMVLETDNKGVVWLEIPGISADDLAIATLSPKDNPGLRVYNEEEAVICEVRALQEEKPGFWLVRCRIS